MLFRSEAAKPLKELAAEGFCGGRILCRQPPRACVWDACHRLAEPTIPPAIDAGYLSDLADVETFIQGIRITGSYVRVTAGGNCAYEDSPPDCGSRNGASTRTADQNRHILN
jgi:hypothetical protein